jgi:hypothetical protein
MLISGPVNLNVLYSKTDKHYVYVFGDIHEDLKHVCKKKEKAPMIYDFLYNLITLNPTVFFNILIETYQINDDIDYTHGNVDAIYKIIDKFKCFSSNKSKYKLKNAMVHYVDYRIMTSYSYITLKFNKKYKESYFFYHQIEQIDYNLLHFLLLFYDKNKYDSDLHMYITIIYNILKDFETNLNINTISDYINYFKKHINYSKIDKQYINIEKQSYVNILRSYSVDFFNILSKKYKNINFNKIISILKRLKQANNINDFNTSDINHLYTFYAFNFEIQSILMDLYAIGRLLRYYKEYNEYNDNTKYSIFYVGNKHSDLYIKLLKEMNFDLLYKSNTYDKLKRCININNAAFNGLKL